MSKECPCRIAVIPGDGIGKEVVHEGLRVLEALSKRFGIRFQFDHFDFASCDDYFLHGKMVPDDWKSLIGIAPVGNINPDMRFPSLFEPVHGSALDITGQWIANPVGQIWSAALMLDHLGEYAAAAAIVQAIETVLAQKHLRTRDLGGPADSVTCGKAIADALR